MRNRQPLGTVPVGARRCQQGLYPMAQQTDEPMGAVPFGPLFPGAEAIYMVSFVVLSAPVFNWGWTPPPHPPD